MISIRKYWNWLCELSAFWAALLLIASSGLVVINLFPTEVGVRLVGLVLQIVGIVSVLAGIERSRRDFNLPPIHELLLNWIQRAPWVRQKPIHGYAQMEQGAQTASAVGSVRVRVGHGTVEDRLRILEESLNATLDAWARQAVALEDAKREFLENIESERAARESANHQSAEKLKQTVLGGIGTAFAGSLVLLAGVAMSTSSPELAKWLG